jgi:hypothetical protein
MLAQILKSFVLDPSGFFSDQMATNQRQAQRMRPAERSPENERGPVIAIILTTTLLGVFPIPGG